MSEPLRLCKHIHDTGRTCASAAVKDQNYCAFHLHHRARLMRMAQYRARCEQFSLRLPPLEDMFAVQSALNQLVEAVAADMLDLTTSCRYLSRLLKNDRIRRYLSKNHADTLAEVDQVVGEVEQELHKPVVSEKRERQRAAS